MSPKKLRKIIISLPQKIKNIIKKIDKNGLGTVFIVDDLNRIRGSITDGDIRRYYLKKLRLPKTINLKSKIVNKKPFFLPISTNIQSLLKYLEQSSPSGTPKFKCIPLVNKKKVIIDIATKENPRDYPVAQPDIGNQELQNVIKAIKSGWISSKGKYIEIFEKKFSNYLNGGFSVSTTSGTTALQLGISSLGISKNDEVIVPSFTFAGSINSIINAGAKPVIVDIEKDTWTIDLEKIKKALTKKTKAVMIVHIYGQPCKIDEIKKFCKLNKLFLIEDCAEAIGATYKGRLVGLDGDCSCFSFFANKTITTGEGGVVVFKSKKIAEYAKILRSHGMSLSKAYWHKFAGFNYRMTNIQAAIGSAQLDKIATLLIKRKKIFRNYDALLKNLKGISLLPSNNWSENSYWLYTIILDSNKIRNYVIQYLKERGIDTRPTFYPLHLMPPYKKFSKMKCHISNKIGLKGLSLPTSRINLNEQKYIVQNIKLALRNKIT